MKTINEIRQINITGYLKKQGIIFKEIRLRKVVHTVEDVVKECNCRPDQVVKSMVCLGINETLILVALKGNQYLNVNKLEGLIQQKMKMASPQQVKELTSFSIGTVPPFLVQPSAKSILLAEKSLLQNDTLYIGSGDKEMIIAIKSMDFKKAFKGKFINL